MVVRTSPLGQIDICLNIFGGASARELCIYAIVCRTWRAFSSSNALWMKLVAEISTKHNFLEDFSPLIAESKIRWKEVYRFAALSILFTKCSERIQKDIHKHPPRVRYGHLTFTLERGRQIAILRSGVQVKLLSVDAKAPPLFKLAVEGKFIFALNESGNVTRWNYETGSRKDFKGIDGVPKDGFLVENGFIVLASKTKKMVMVIPYADDDPKVKIINGFDIPLPWVMIVERENLYILGEKTLSTIHLKDGKNISIDLSTKIKFPLEVISSKRGLWLVEKHEKIRLIDRITGKDIKKISFTATTFVEIKPKFHYPIVVENLLFAYGKFTHMDKEEAINVINLESERAVGKISAPSSPVSKKINAKTLFMVFKKINPETLCEMVSIAQKHFATKV